MSLSSVSASTRRRSFPAEPPPAELTIRLGELVRARIMLERAREAMRGVAPGSSVIIHVAPSKLSQTIGQHRSNIDALLAESGAASIKVRPDENGDTLRLEVCEADDI